MDWLRENWFWVAIGILFLGTHLRGHGGHGHRRGHGGCGGTGHAGRPEHTTTKGQEDRHASH